MDEDLLDDDGQFKDDGLEDLDLDEEAALLGLSDEEIEDSKTLSEEQQLEYVDEEGNPLEIGESNAELYEVANVDVKKLRTSPDEDILDLDLDSELDGFNQENPESSIRESSLNTSNEKQFKSNLISLTSRNEREKVQSLKRRESIHSPVKEIESSSINIAYVSKSLTSSSHLAAETYEDEDLEFDEESEDESMADDHRERFKSERSNIITLTPAKKRADIPDTLDSVISVEETAKVQAFLDNEQKRKMRFKGRPLPRMKSATYARSPQPFGCKPFLQHQTAPQFSSAPVPQTLDAPPTSTSSRKILINPHFRGVRVPPTTGQTHVANENSPLSMPVPVAMPSYEQPILSTTYSHQDTMSQINAVPMYSTQSPTVPYSSPDYSTSQSVQQTQPPIWQTPPPEIPPPVSYSNPPPPVINYGSHPPNYNNYSNNYPNASYQTPPPVPVAQSIAYNQPPPPLHLQPPAYTSPPMNTIQTNTGHMQFSSSQPNNQQSLQEPYHQRVNIPQSTSSNMQRNTFSQNQHLNQSMHQQSQQPQNFQQKQNMRSFSSNLRPLQQNQQTHPQNQRFRKQNQRQQNQPQNQRFLRQAEKRPSHTNIKEVPIKQSRTDIQTSRKNTHVNNPNIREIPLIDTLPAASQLSETRKSIPVVEEEDEQTKELRVKIEEQKRLREQILKQKEERRRQMAAQRMLEVKQRQSEQNKNIIPLTQRSEPAIPVKQPILPPDQPKLSAKERIGLPVCSVTPTNKKKTIVLRKKSVQNLNNVNIAEPKKVITLGQKVGIQTVKSTQNKPTVNIMPNITTIKTNAAIKQTTQASIFQKKKIISLKRNTQINKIQAPNSSQSVAMKNNNNNNLTTALKQTPKKGPVLSRLGNRPGFLKKYSKSPHLSFHQRPGQPSPRFQRQRGPQFQSPSLLDHQMRGPALGQSLNDMRPPLTSPPSFHEPRPPLLPFGPPRERLPFDQFRFEPNHPQFRSRDPGDLNRPPFHPQGPGELNRPPFHPQSSGNLNRPQFRAQGPGDLNHLQFGDHGRHQFRGPDPNHPNNHQFRPPGFQNFRPRGMDMFPSDRFPPPPQFQNQMNQPRRMFEPNNFQRPRFYQNSNIKQRFSRPNHNQQKQRSVERDHKNLNNPAASQVYKPKSGQSTTTPENTAENSQVSKHQHFDKNKQEGLLTQTVAVENLSSSTNETHLRKLCTTVGVVEDINMMKNERKAVIRFKEVDQALSFQKKYQRYMLDLAMIQVSLVAT